MNASAPDKGPIRVGSDVVRFEDDRLLIESAVTMEWPIREFCRVPIFFQGQKYYLRGKRPGAKRGTTIYELWPWPANLHEAAREQVYYDEEYVSERDEIYGCRKRADWFYILLFPFYPLLGLFWSRFKDRVLGPMGFESQSITKASIALTFGLFIVQGIYVGWFLGGFFSSVLGLHRLLLVDWVLWAAMGLDCLTRFTSSLKDEQIQFGFCEWLFRSPKRGEN